MHMHARVHHSRFNFEKNSSKEENMNRLILLKVKKRFSLCILAVSAIVSLAFAASAGQDSLTVKEAVDKIVQNNHTLHSLAAQLDAAQAKTQNTKRYKLLNSK